jgi:SRSO17 transposase
LDEVMARVGPRFCRVEPRRRVRAFVTGLLAGLPRTNCWTIAEHAGDPSPDGMQHLLAGAVWDAGGVRDDLRGYVVEQLGDPDAVLVVDETGDLKKGTATVGVQRQYTGTAGRIENAQVAVYLTYAGARGYAFIDRALYLPRSWTEDLARCAAVGVPEEVEFATKPALATAMIARALDAGSPARWAAGDEVYGADPGLRKELVRREIGYVLAVAKDHPITTGIGTRRADELAVRLPKRAWQRLSAGAGAKGERFYDWALVQTIDTPPPTPRPPATTGCCSAATNAAANWPTTAPTVRPRSASPPWSRSPAPAGRSKSPSSPARNSPAWTNTRSAAGPPGTAGRSWPCSPTPTCPS